MTKKKSAELPAKKVKAEEEEEETSTDETETEDEETTEDETSEEETEDESDGEESEDESDDEDESDGDSEQHIKAELEKEKSAREKAERALAKLAFKGREKKRQGEDANEESEEDETDDEDRPLTHREFQRMREADRKELLKSEAERIASEFSDNPNIKELIVTKWQNRSFPSDQPLREQIEDMFILTQKKRLMGENNELKRALKNKGRVSKDASQSQQRTVPRNQPKLAPADAAEMARLGFKWINSRYEKKLSNGDTLVKDPKTKKTRIEKA